ncbi:MAG: helix-turn-helix domain-containing protein [Rectinemataceae bacterium]
MKVYTFCIVGVKGMEFGERLRKTRDDKGLSQQDLAERAGIQASAVSHFELGRRLPSFDNIRRLADALNVSSDFLLGREDVMKVAGPEAAALFREYKELSSEDQQALSKFAEHLAAQKKEKDAKGKS